MKTNNLTVYLSAEPRVKTHRMKPNDPILKLACDMAGVRLNTATGLKRGLRALNRMINLN